MGADTSQCCCSDDGEKSQIMNRPQKVDALAEELAGIPEPVAAVALAPSVLTPAASSSASLRQSCRDVDGDGNYHLHFMYQPGLVDLDGKAISTCFGLQLMDAKLETDVSGLLVVSHVEPSGSFAYTSKHSPGLYAGDTILQVNGTKGSAETLRGIVNQIATNGGQLDLIVRPRPEQFDVVLQRKGPKKVGVSASMDRADPIPRMRVRTIRHEGLVQEWNTANPALWVCRGDWITQVNGVTKTPEEMYAMILSSTQGQELKFRIEPPARDAPRQEMEVLTPRSPG